MLNMNPWEMLPEGVSVTAVLAAMYLFNQRQKVQDQDRRESNQEWRQTLQQIIREHHESQKRQSKEFRESLEVIVDRIAEKLDQQSQNHVQILERLDELRNRWLPPLSGPSG